MVEYKDNDDCDNIPCGIIYPFVNTFIDIKKIDRINIYNQINIYDNEPKENTHKQHISESGHGGLAE